jgi:hypothetical protein
MTHNSMTVRRAAALLTGLCACILTSQAIAQRPPQGPPLKPKQAALIDVTGYWVAQMGEDWRWRMMTPAIGETTGIPVNPAGTQFAKAWDPSKDMADHAECRVYGAAGLMRLPERLHVYWVDDQTLEIDTDAGMQKRILHFRNPQAAVQSTPDEAPSLQGVSSASWFRQRQRSGFVPQFGPPKPGQGGSLKVVTTNMTPGYLRANGVPYSGNAVLKEYFDRVEDEGSSYLILTTVVQDPAYLNEEYISSYQFKLEPNNAKWNPKPCKINLPTSKTVPGSGF